MKLFDIKKLAAVSAFSLTAILGMSIATSAQGNRDQRNMQKQQQEKIKLQDKWEQQRSKAEQDRLRAEQQRQAELNRRNPRTSPSKQIGGGFYNVHPNPVVNNNPRYRVYRNGSYYNTDNRGADLLRQAVNAGYQQGFATGKSDRNSRRGLNWNDSSVYRSGTYGYQSYVDRGQYQYYFQQGFQRGYQDGYNSRYQYGQNSGGSVSILGSILGSILNIQSY